MLFDFLKEIIVMVVDDQSPVEKKRLLRTLEELGFTVIWKRRWSEVRDYLDLCSQTGKARPDVALVDLHFKPDYCELSVKDPDGRIEGALIVQELRRLYRELPVVGFTSSERMEWETMLKFGASDFITKDEYNEDGAILGRRLLQSIKYALLQFHSSGKDDNDGKGI